MMYKRNNEIYTGGNTTILFKGGVFMGTPTEEQLLSWGFEKVIEPEPTEQELVEQSKQHKLEELDTYDNSPAVNSFTLGGVSMWLDAPTRQLLRTSIEAYKELGLNTVTKWFNGVSFTFPVDTWLYMLNLVEVYAAEALNVTEAHRANIKSFESVDDIDIYDFTLNYPNKVVL